MPPPRGRTPPAPRSHREKASLPGAEFPHVLLILVHPSPQLLIGKTVQSIRFVGNIGFGILGDPTRGDNQNDVFEYGFSVARAVAEGVEIVGELNGRTNTRSGTPPVGTESRSIMRVGGRLTKGTVRIDGAILLGLTSRDPGFGFTAGMTYVFKGFTVK